MPPDAIRRNGCARAELDTPIGVVTVVASEEGIREVVLPGDGTAVAGPELRTLAVGMYAFRGEFYVDWSGMAAAATISLLPIIIVFLFMQRYFVEGIAGAVKQ